MTAEEPLGVGLVYSNDNGNCSVCNLVFESKDSAVSWATENLLHVGATDMKTTDKGVEAMQGLREVRWSFIRLHFVSIDTKALPHREHYESFC